MRVLVNWGVGAVGVAAVIVGILWSIGTEVERSGHVGSASPAASTSPVQPASMPWITSVAPDTDAGARRPFEASAALLPAEELVDWRQLPRGLGASLAEAREVGNGQLAYVVAQALQRCTSISSEMAAYRENAGHLNDAKLRRILADQFAEKQRIYSQCQTVQGDVKSQQLQMLEVALAGNVVGAAASLLTHGQDSGRIRAAVLADAKAGDLISLALVASGEPEKYSMDASSQRIFQSALVTAANSTELREVASSALVLAQKWNAYRLAAAEPSEANLALAKQVWAGTSDGLPFSNVDPAGSADGNSLAAELQSAIKRRNRGH